MTITILAAAYVDPPAGSYSTPDNGKILMLDVQWVATKGASDPSPIYFIARDPDGREADDYYGVDDRLPSTPLVEGDTARGNLAFDVKPNTEYTVRFLPDLTKPVAQLVIKP
ncbi:hypothetical protein JT358_04535 [Micrococcales bacterium 31B]|nr:hypothetical protein [Micrococcales bacterium 31B]